jgi:hypothetical protein
MDCVNFFIQYAILGDYGTFEMEISADDAFMSWTAKLQNLDQLAIALGVDVFSSLSYHLHQQWTSVDSDVGFSAIDCGPNVTGGHYDPFFGCGPATGVPSEQCIAIGKPTEAYECSVATYRAGNYSKCEVGDLSGKYGPIPVSAATGVATVTVDADPFPAHRAHYAGDRRAATFSAETFASIVFHNNGSPRVLCGRLALAGGSSSSDDDPEDGGQTATSWSPPQFGVPGVGVLLTGILWEVLVRSFLAL